MLLFWKRNKEGDTNAKMAPIRSSENGSPGTCSKKGFPASGIISWEWSPLTVHRRVYFADPAHKLRLSL